MENLPQMNDDDKGRLCLVEIEPSGPDRNASATRTRVTFRFGNGVITLDKSVKSLISNGPVKRPRSRLAGRESELWRANGKSIQIITANIYVPSRGMRRTYGYSAVTRDEA